MTTRRRIAQTRNNICIMRVVLRLDIKRHCLKNKNYPCNTLTCCNNTNIKNKEGGGGAIGRHKTRQHTGCFVVVPSLDLGTVVVIVLENCTVEQKDKHYWDSQILQCFPLILYCLYNY
jgi:hypothetical protein